MLFDRVIIAFANDFSSLWVKSPVLLCCTVSLTPPSLTPTTGVPQAIASNGTYPKGSKYGAYTTNLAVLYSLINSTSEIIEWISSFTFFLLANVLR